jgi:hypothetical protein
MACRDAKCSVCTSGKVLCLALPRLTCLLSLMHAVGAFSFGSIALHGVDVLKWAVLWALVFILVAPREEFRARV